jgi:hypothetical protein
MDVFYEARDIGWTKGKKKFLFPYKIKFQILHEAINPPRISYSTIDEGNKAKWVKPNFIDILLSLQINEKHGINICKYQ